MEALCERCHNPLSADILCLECDASPATVVLPKRAVPHKQTVCRTSLPPTPEEVAVRATIAAQITPRVRKSRHIKRACNVCAKPLVSRYTDTCYTCRTRDEVCTFCGHYGAPTRSRVEFECRGVEVHLGDILCLACTYKIMHGLGDLCSAAKRRQPSD